MKKIFIICSLFLSTTIVSMAQTCEEIPLEVTIIDPTENIPPIRRGPVAIPRITLIDGVLYFSSSCNGCFLHLLNENGDIEYSAVIPTGNSITLPSYLSGTYRIEIIRGYFCLWGFIHL